MPNLLKSKWFGLSLVAFVYITALLLSYGIYLWIPISNPIWKLLVMDLAATIYVYIWSCIWRNASLYDPYWSAIPPFLGLFWLDHYFSSIGWNQIPVKLWIIYSLVVLWGIRLTWNWTRWFTGLDYEDWRYRNFRKNSGKWFPLVNLFAIQVFPTIMVFMGSLSLSFSLSFSNPSRIVIFYIIFFVITFVAILIETDADLQLHKFVKKRTEPGQIMNNGLWSHSRHPNYFGEVFTWWGLFFFALVADLSSWWVIVGHLAITVLFLGYSVPALDKYQISKKEAYIEYKKNTPGFFPRIIKRNK